VRRLAVAVAALAVVGLTGGPALGHATLDKSSLPADSEQSLQVRVPVERPAAYNVKIIVEVPAGFTALTCADKLGWRCAITADRAQGRSALVTWERTAGLDAIDLLDWTVRTPAAPGTYAVEVNQFYSDGEVVQWDGAPDSDHPAPRLEITGAGTRPVENTESAESHSTPPPAPAAAAPSPGAPAAPARAPGAPAAPDPAVQPNAADAPDDAAGQAGPAVPPVPSGPASPAPPAPDAQPATASPSPGPDVRADVQPAPPDGGPGWPAALAGAGLIVGLAVGGRRLLAARRG
jgi:uncharacterized protein YcnI